MSDSQEIIVPALGESVTEATIAKWLKNAGDAVKRDDPLVELETDKVTLEVMAPEDGVLTSISAQVGSTVEVGAVLGVLQKGASSSQPAIQSTDESPEHTDLQESPEKSAGMASKNEGAQSGPAARKLLDEHNLSSDQVKGTAKDGRVSKADVLNAIEEKPTSSAALESALKSNNGPAHTNNSGDDRLEKHVPMTRLRQRIAQRLKEAQNTAAILTTFNEVDMTGINKVRNAYKDDFLKKHDVKLGFMSFFIKAAIQALKEIPAVNAQIDGTDIIYKDYYDIGVAISAPQGLVVPILRDAHLLSFADIEKAIIGFGDKAKNNRLTIEEMTGGTFSISNGGVFGSLMSTPILNPPQSAILGMHKVQDRPVVIDGKIEIRPMMYLALSYDHRLIDGREAVTFLKRIKDCVEAPERLLFDV